MNPRKVQKSLTHFENYLVVHKHVSPITAKGYSRSLSNNQ